MVPSIHRHIAFYRNETNNRRQHNIHTLLPVCARVNTQPTQHLHGRLYESSWNYKQNSEQSVCKCVNYICMAWQHLFEMHTVYIMGAEEFKVYVQVVVPPYIVQYK